MITLYHRTKTRSSRFIFLLEELGAPYQIKHVVTRTAQGGEPDPANPHPHGKVPAISDDGEIVFESTSTVTGVANEPICGTLLTYGIALPFASFGAIIGNCVTVTELVVSAVTIPMSPTGAPAAGRFEASRYVARPARVYVPDAGVGSGVGLESEPLAAGAIPANKPPFDDGAKVGADVGAPEGGGAPVGSALSVADPPLQAARAATPPHHTAATATGRAR